MRGLRPAASEPWTPSDRGQPRQRLRIATKDDQGQRPRTIRCRVEPYWIKRAAAARHRRAGLRPGGRPGATGHVSRELSEPVLELLVSELVGDPGRAQKARLLSPVQECTEADRPGSTDGANHHTDVVGSPHERPTRQRRREPEGDSNRETVQEPAPPSETEHETDHETEHETERESGAAVRPDDVSRPDSLR